MSNPPPLSPAECLTTIIRCLSLAMVPHSGVGWFTPRMITLLVDRLRGIAQHFARVAERIAAGTYVPRRAAATPRRRPAGRRQYRPSPLPQGRGWLLKLLPEAAGYRSQIEYLFRDPATAALLAAAPGPLGRPLRSLCWMLLIDPPQAIAPPTRPRPARTTRPRAPEPSAQPAPAAGRPAAPPYRTRAPLTRIRGSPHRT